MARQEVIQVRCDRCKRVELQPPQPQKAHPDFEARFLETRLVYEDICTSCQETLKNVWKDLAEWDRKLTQSFGPQVQSNQAAPLEVAPDYSPPKPHSAAGGKRG
jgi:hypothetical protein